MAVDGGVLTSLAGLTLPIIQQMENPRQQLNQMLQKELGRPLTKTDVTFVEEAQQSGGWAATISIEQFGLTIKGAACQDKKSAQQACAFLALVKLSQRLSGAAPVATTKKNKNKVANTTSKLVAKPKAAPVAQVGVKRKAGHTTTPQSHTAKRLKLNDVEFADKQCRTAETSIKRTEEEKAEAIRLYQSWRDERCVKVDDAEGKRASSFDAWFGQVCLVCLTECQLTNWELHAVGARHLKNYKALSGFKLAPGLTRLEPMAKVNLRSNLSHVDFGKVVSKGSVLGLGEQDYSFSLRIAQMQHQTENYGGLIATSYLAEHDPDEPEIHVADDGERNLYKRRSLPAMGGALQKNIDDLQALGGIAMHSVDATDLLTTLRGQGVDASFDTIVFPFPRASLKRGCDPRNSNLLRAFFRSTVECGLLNLGGTMQLLLLANQYGEWDTAAAAQEQGFYLFDRLALPDGFYQSREMSGKAWTPKNAELYVFKKKSR